MVKINGKEYRTVAQRLNLIATEYKDYELTSEIIKLSESACCIRATLKLGDRIFNGIAFEEKQSSYINKTSYVENCETSAWGRAMAAAGHAGLEIASAEEVANALLNQEHNTDYKKLESRDNIQQPLNANKEEMSKEDINKLKEEIHKICQNMSPDEKRAALKKASHYVAKTTGKESFIDDINELKRGNYDTPSWQLKLTLKKLQEAMLSKVAAEFVSNTL